jgi:multidrug efflux pump subunit AcrB
MSDKQERLGGIGGLSVKNPVLVNILMVTVIALGAFSMLRLPQEQFAEIPFYWVNIIVPYPGVSAEDLESSVTVPIENEFQGIDKLSEITSTTSEGLAIVRVEFDDGISQQEFDTLFQDAQTRFNRVDLPDGILNPIVDDFSSADFAPVIELVLSGDLPYGILRNEALSLRDDILGVTDVSGVDLVGLREREIILDTSPEKLAALGLSTTEILQAVNDRNTSVPGGRLATDGREFLLRTLSTVNEIDDFAEIIIRRTGADGSGIIRVQDVAEVIDGFNPDSGINRINGEQSISLRVSKVPGGSSIAVVDGIKAVLAEQEAGFADQLKVTLINDSTVQIQDSLSVLTSNALIGLLLLVIILSIFIGIRNALMTALGIPVTFAITFVVLELLGETLNTNTLFGLVLVLGLIVDHAIVIIENSYRLKQQGLSRHEAAIKGTNQVVWPVIAATATTVAAFLPLMIIPGTIGRFLRVIPLTVAIALIASTGEALFFLPSHFADWGKKKKQAEGEDNEIAANANKKTKKRREPGAWFEVIRVGFDKFFTKIYHRRGLVLFLTLIIAVGSFALVPFLNQDLFAAEDFSFFTIDITMPRGTPLSKSDEVLARFEERLISRVGDGEVQSVIGTAGSLASQTGISSSSNLAQITVDLSEVEEGRTRPIQEIINEISEELDQIPGPEEVIYRKAVTGPPTAAALSFRVRGDNYDQITQVTTAIQELLRNQPGVFNIEDDFEPGSPELQIVVDEERATALGLSVGSIGSFVRAKFDGLTLGRYFQDNEEIDIVLRFGNSGANNYDQLVNALIPTVDGRLIPFSSVARVEPGESAGSIRRVDGKREVTITAGALDGIDLRPINAQIESFYNNQLEPLYPDLEFNVGGEFGEFQDLLIQILRVFLLGIFLIYLILGAQFKSYSQPFIILLSVPFAFVGVILYLAISGTPFSTTVLYAGVALAGIAVNDAIVLISFINQLRADGMPIGEAVRTAAGTRLRPIILTSLTTIVGLLPTALGIGGTSVVWGPMASTIIFGLLFSTVTALVIIPSLYGKLYDKKKKGKKVLRKKTNKERTVKVAQAVALIMGIAMVFGTADPVSAQSDLSLDSYVDLFNRENENQTGTAEAVAWDQIGSDLYNTVFNNLEPVNYEELFDQIKDIVSQGRDAQQLLSALRLASEQLENTFRTVLPTISMNSGSTAPSLFTYTRGDFSGFGDGDPDDQNMDINLSLGLSQNLPTGANVFVTGTSNWDFDNPAGGGDDWDLTIKPSFVAGIVQPLFLDGGLISGDIISTGISNSENQRDAANEAYINTSNSLSLQIIELLSQRLQLIEQYQILVDRLDILEIQKEQAEQDFARGVISQTALNNQTNIFNTQSNALETLKRDIIVLEGNIQLLLDSGEADQLNEQLFNDYLIPSLARPLSEPDWGLVKDEILLRDNRLLDAQRDKVAARANLLLAGQADAPVLSVNLALNADSFESSDVKLIFSANLSISDPFRKAFLLQQEIYNEQILQANLSYEKALGEIDIEVDELRNEWQQLSRDVATQLEDYRLAIEAYEEEQIRFSQGGSNEIPLRQTILTVHERAFQTLQTLRKLFALQIEVSILTGQFG